MKIILFILLFVKSTLFSFGQAIDISEAFGPEFRLEGDSGYVQKVQADRILDFLAERIDSLHLKNAEKHHFWKDTDTIGKFIFLPQRNRYFLCLHLFEYESMGEPNCILELETHSDKVVLKNFKVYFHGNYACCWGRDLDGFVKWNDFVVYKMCGTGSSLCSSHWILLNDLSDQAIPIEFVHDFWFGDETEYKMLDSKVEWIDDTLILTYRLEKGSIKNKGKRLRFKKKTTELILRKGVFKDHGFEFDKPLPDIES